MGQKKNRRQQKKTLFIVPLLAYAPVLEKKKVTFLSRALRRVRLLLLQMFVAEGPLVVFENCASGRDGLAYAVLVYFCLPAAGGA